jgi:hypothetical protein
MAIACLLLCAGCTALLSADAAQCHSTEDCARFGQAVCDTEHHVCRPRASTTVDSSIPDVGPDAVLVCQIPGGCFRCTPTSDPELLSACTDSTCIPFDNARLTNLNSDGTLKPLP